MKIEVGESLFYSWLRHVKECQIVQTNWKVSLKWLLQNEDELQNIMLKTSEFFLNKYNYNIYKQNSYLSQLLRQSESDAIGICVKDGLHEIYAIDIAFHESGLNYGNTDETISRVIKKCIITAMCIRGYFDAKNAEIIFSSPKIHNHILNNLINCFDDINLIMQEFGFEFKFRLIANDDFLNLVLKPILDVGANVADTAELFMRSYQMLCMFENKNGSFDNSKLLEKNQNYEEVENKAVKDHSDDYAEFKVGQIARFVMKRILASGKVDLNEISNLQNDRYSKLNLHLNYPVLVRDDAEYDKLRYYKEPILINGLRYKLCNDWYEGVSNNDRPYLIDWIKKYK